MLERSLVCGQGTDDDGQRYDGAVHGGDAIITRDMITMVGIKFTQPQRNKQGGWKLTAATKRHIEASKDALYNLSKA